MLDLVKNFLAQPFVKKFALDAFETGLAAVLALQLAWPASFSDLKGLAITIGAAILGAVISAARRALPDALAWLKAKLGL